MNTVYLDEFPARDNKVDPDPDTAAPLHRIALPPVCTLTANVGQSPPGSCFNTHKQTCKCALAGNTRVYSPKC